ncbi:molecular chaperone DnaJ [Motiliproteus sp. MSK22-1]|uniref:molecular chaperone DnaJ n=1 Tax=Motiliproteus sp. MSK22-1 TaxID=1897630 RepID=UPI0009754F5C|nr:molecular chaperone DnaJ [Motiliproteus sp. MSK22-1]OMH28075.1 molecular chaperone DnaJ [Motiliproteus sp. MSK22-1]
MKVNLYPCAHCEGKGTCKNGGDGSSCTACVKRNDLKGKEYSGLLCGACGGLGMAEPYTERINKRTKPILAVVIVFVMLFMIIGLALSKNPHFPEVLAFAGTLIGGVVAYYFSSNSS